MLIRALVITAAVLCADETPIRVGPGPKTRKKYLLVACTSLLTYRLESVPPESDSLDVGILERQADRLLRLLT